MLEANFGDNPLSCKAVLEVSSGLLAIKIPYERRLWTYLDDKSPWHLFGLYFVTFGLVESI